jgi:16S rRNA processing protein RimM
MDMKLEDKQNKSKLVVVGKILAAHGIKGNVSIISFTDPAANILKLPLLTAKSCVIKLKLVHPIANKNRLVCNINDIQDRTIAEKLIGVEVFCLRSDFPQIDDQDEFYVTDLQNLTVVDQSLQPVGKVKNILNFGAGDIIEVQFTDQTKELFPFTKAIFPEITSDYVMIKPT